MIKLLKIIKLLFEPLNLWITNNNFKVGTIYSYFLKFLKLSKNVVFYESYHGKNATCNPYAIFLHLQKDSKYKNFKHVWALNEVESETVKELRKYKNVKIVKRPSVKYLYYLSKAKYLINNTSFPQYYQKKEGQIYINTWHGVPFKKIGADSNESGISDHGNIQKNLLHVDYLVSPNKFTHEKLLQSNRVNEIFNGKIIDAGYPRIDLTFQTDTLEMKKVLNIDTEKQVILYAPTWREWDKGKEEIAVERTYNLFLKLKEQYSDEYEVLLKAHYFVYRHFKEAGLEKYCVPDWIDTNKLLSCVDILLTDFSSIFFDFLHSKKPVIFFMYDKEEYIERRGTYLDVNELPGPICESVEEVTEAIDSIDKLHLTYTENYKKMLDTYCYNDDGHATERVVDIIFNGVENDYVYKIDTDKKKILFWGGGFYTNGITVSFLNLLKNIDYSKYHISVIFASRLNNVTISNLQKIHPSVTVIYRKGTLNYSLGEYYTHKIVNSFGLNKGWVRKILPKSLYKNELNRVIGNTEYDIGIDFDGYTSLWTLIFAFNKFKKKYIYLHSDMFADAERTVNGKAIHRKNFNIIFNLYKYFDKLICVSKDVTEINKVSFEKFNVSDKIININNSIDYHRVLDNLEVGNLVQNDKEYLILDHKEEHGSLSLRGVLHPIRENVNFVALGRLSPEKDFEKLIKAFSQVNKKYENTNLFIIGDGALKGQLKSLAKSLGIEEKIIFTGQIENPFPLIYKCDCFVLSSNYEGQGLVILEALILEKPVIATDIPGPRGILEDGYGKLVENTVEGFARGMEEYIVNRPTYKKFDYFQYNQNAIEAFYKEMSN